MSLVTHPATGFAVGDPARLPLDPASPPSAAELARFASGLILSASGWRGVFAASGEEESAEESVSPAGLIVAAAMAEVFADYLLSLEARPRIALGIDARPTGPALADAMARVFLAKGLETRYAYIVAAPEIMAWTRAAPIADEGALSGFCYISASHNPQGHNGVKFGLADGGVLSGAQIGPLIATLKDRLADPAAPSRLAALLARADARLLGRCFAECAAWKRRAFSAYLLFSRAVVADTPELAEQERVLDALAAESAARSLGVLAEMNGSARSLSIDVDFLESLGLNIKALNAAPRAFVHRIVPEGAGLDLCRAELEKAAALDPGFLLGYVPDCDGDRGNLVRVGRDGSARALDAQEVFALAVLAELASSARAATLQPGVPLPRLAVVVNDATSMRIEAIAAAFGAEVRRAETGEANVVGLARALREEGYLVRILGEGSNGGNITHPASVRDPLNTVASLLKLLCLRDGPEGPGLFHSWLAATGREAGYEAGFHLDDVVASLPAFATTSVFEDRAALRVRETDHAALKRRYQSAFLSAWPELRAALASSLGIASYKALSTNGMVERELADDWGESGRGGLRIQLLNAALVPMAFLWMRGSGTEPVFRVMADVAGGDPSLERQLLDRHVALIREADSAASA